MIYFAKILLMKLISVATWSKVWASSHLLGGIADWNPAGSMDVCLFVSVVS